jgi:hypothetical protein
MEPFLKSKKEDSRPDRKLSSPRLVALSAGHCTLPDTPKIIVKPLLLKTGTVWKGIRWKRVSVADAAITYQWIRFGKKSSRTKNGANILQNI